VRNQEKLGSPVLQLFQMAKSGTAISGVVPDVAPVVTLRKMRRSAVAYLQQIIVPFADDKHVTALWHAVP
jgi:hypothetical protein